MTTGHKNLLVLLLMAVAVSVKAEDLATKNDFRGVRCGAPLPAGMQKQWGPQTEWWRSGRWDDGTTCYKRPSDHLTVGNAKLTSIDYHFFEGKFLGADILPADDQPLLEVLVASFGQGRIQNADEYMNETAWDGTHMAIRAPGLAPLYVYSVAFICKDVLATKEKQARRLLDEEKQRQKKRAQPKPGDF